MPSGPAAKNKKKKKNNKKKKKTKKEKKEKTFFFGSRTAVLTPAVLEKIENFFLSLTRIADERVQPSTQTSTQTSTQASTQTSTQANTHANTHANTKANMAFLEISVAQGVSQAHPPQGVSQAHPPQGLVSIFVHPPQYLPPPPPLERQVAAPVRTPAPAQGAAEDPVETHLEAQGVAAGEGEGGASPGAPVLRRRLAGGDDDEGADCMVGSGSGRGDEAEHKKAD